MAKLTHQSFPKRAQVTLLAKLCAVLSVALIASCASEKKVTRTKSTKDMWGKESSWRIEKDAQGNTIAKSDKRSGFEGKRSGIAGHRDFGGRDYTTSAYRKKRWGGNTRFDAKSYQGNTDASRYKNEPWFARQQASSQGQRSRADGKSYGTGRYATGAAREAGTSRIARKSDAETDIRRRVYKQPDVTHWKKQQGLSIKDTNRMLGR